tara:strand:- start:709 stop:969 length:261 start_codon:yes stop_codon:yes gene_type:complete
MNMNWNYIMGFTPTTARSVLRFEFPDHFFKLIKNDSKVAYEVYLRKPSEQEMDSVTENITYFKRNFNGGKSYNFHWIVEPVEPISL